ncbi:hypothetical protein [Aliiglaciecola litoralis]|uniref:SnoaL-like domain-containing protein n=1 Tax=Aliiglaciecola litoralis TaxID=582857 RepID=A0ABN1LEY1_9ALTE
MNPLNLLIIVLLILNLVATVWFGINQPQVQPIEAVRNKITHNLPGVVNASVRKQLVDEYIKHFNSQNLDGLYAMFSPAAKAQFSKQKSDETFTKLITYFRSVRDGAFTHSEFVGANGDTKHFVLHYALKLDENSDFSQTGTLKVTIAVRGTEFEIYGIHMNAG